MPVCAPARNDRTLQQGFDFLAVDIGKQDNGNHQAGALGNGVGPPNIGDLAGEAQQVCRRQHRSI